MCCSKRSIAVESSTADDALQSLASKLAPTSAAWVFTAGDSIGVLAASSSLSSGIPKDLGPSSAVESNVSLSASSPRGAIAEVSEPKSCGGAPTRVGDRSSSASSSESSSSDSLISSYSTARSWPASAEECSETSASSDCSSSSEDPEARVGPDELATGSESFLSTPSARSPVTERASSPSLSNTASRCMRKSGSRGPHRRRAASKRPRALCKCSC
mmetsp:Transcript_46287/g.86740  ORF Transcript_46287/g.86740 Transcript_46287/m.86740 type:complete len:216 (-) Transcript_46287:275-922(-)